MYPTKRNTKRVSVERYSSKINGNQTYHTTPQEDVEFTRAKQCYCSDQSISYLIFIPSIRRVSSRFQCSETAYKRYYSDDVVLKKGVYPYDFMDDEVKMVLPNIPAQADFNSALSKTACSDDEYKTAQTTRQ